ncbi:MAG: FAD-binding protein [Armatimonadetes bacterium]|nr:FAD-binding protein [Armatimonadota bacterium]
MAPRVRLEGAGTKATFMKAAPQDCLTISTQSISGIVSVSPGDQMVTVWAGTLVSHLQQELATHGQALPLLDPNEFGKELAGCPGTVGGLLAANLPSGLSSQHGEPRDWLLHADVLFRGQQAQCGAKVVKNVAGYDVHKFLCGTWGQMAPFLQVTLKTCPIRALKGTSAVRLRAAALPVWILRTLPTLFDRVLEGAEGLVAHDRASCTLWSDVRPPTPEEGWIIGPAGQAWSDNLQPGLTRAAKLVFDPEDRWQ